LAAFLRNNFNGTDRRLLQTGLPDFSWSKIPKWGKYTKLPQNIPNGHKVFPMAVK
jgi:hypothetical protein